MGTLEAQIKRERETRLKVETDFQKKLDELTAENDNLKSKLCTLEKERALENQRIFCCFRFFRTKIFASSR